MLVLQAIALSLSSRTLIVKHGSNKEEERDNTNANTEVAISNVDIRIAHHGLLILIEVIIITTKRLPVLSRENNYNFGSKAPDNPPNEQNLVNLN